MGAVRFADPVANIGEQLGISGAASERRVAIGGDGKEASLGGVWIFERAALDAAPAGDAAAWMQSGNKLIATDPSLGLVEAIGDAFGAAIALDHDNLLVGAPLANDGAGAVFYFRKDGDSWVEKQVLLPEAAGAASSFGSSVSIRGNVALVGAPTDEEAAPFAGAAYYFALEGDNWQLKQKLTGIVSGLDATLLTDASFGSAVAISELALVVGAPYENRDSAMVEGSASVFTRLGTDEEFVLAKKYVGTSPVGYEFVGSAVAISETRALIGALGVVNAGEAVLLDGSNGWETEKLFHPPATESDAAFGASVAISGSRTLIGASSASRTGRAYSSALARGEGCDSSSDCESGFCTEGVCCNVACSDGCSSCLAALKGSGNDGTCGPVKAGGDPKKACASLPASTCGTTGACDGVGACAVHAKGVECAPGVCNGVSATAAGACDGKQTCVVPQPKNCAPGYACDAGECAQKCDDDDDCDLAHGFGRRNGTCGVVRGGACEATADCLSGDFCSAGLCCDRQCDGPCQECGLDGVCHDLADGATPKAACANEGDVCFSGACSAISWCSADETRELHVDGTSRDCLTTRCMNGSCIERCASSNECADGLTCRPSDNACVVDEARTVASTACSVAAPGRPNPGGPSPWFVAAIGCLLSVRRGKRQSARPWLPCV